MNNALEYGIGFGTLPSGEVSFVGIRPKADSQGYDICIFIGWNFRNSQTWLEDLAEAMKLRPTFDRVVRSSDGTAVVEAVKEEPGWFKRICQSANCEWVLPLFERVLNGDNVSIEEIENCYSLNNNGATMPFSTWTRMLINVGQN